MSRARLRRWFALVVVAAAAIAIGIPCAHLVRTAIRDRDTMPAVPAGYADDASRLSAARVREVWPVPESTTAAERQLVDLLQRARRERLPVSVAGARHSMGGHTIAPGGVVVDMLPLRAMSLSADGRVLTVQAGALWADVIPYLGRHGRSVAVMQSDQSFSVGGSLSVNVHGWQVRRPPIASTVKSFRILLADGRILRCSREENPELFSLALGGYGLFGIILDAELWTVPDEWYEAERLTVPADRFARLFRERIDGDGSVEMAYGRLRVTRKGFLDDAVMTLYRKISRGAEPLPEPHPSALDPLRRTVFRGSVGSDYGKRLRWNLESAFGEKIGGDVASRNQLLSGDIALYVNRTEGHTDVLHEYFLPPDRLASFLTSARHIIPSHDVDLLNVTLRDVRTDDDTFLKYADREMIAVVMLFDQERTNAADAEMQAMTRELIDASLSLGGKYYLPYRPHATEDQFLRAYPGARELAMRKREYDPEALFRNEFYTRYVETAASRH